MSSGNIFQSIPGDLPSEISDALLDDGHVRIERIVSRGHASPPDLWYDQDRPEWVLVLRGEGRVRFADGRVVDMKAGDFLHIPARAKHRVDWTSPAEDTIWLAVFH